MTLNRAAAQCLRSSLLLLLGFASPLIAAPPRPATLGLNCSGSETLRSSADRERIVSYAIRLNIDLSRGLYCYAACDPIQTYRIADPTSTPIRLAAMDTPQQSRQLLFDPETMSVIDDQHLIMTPLHIEVTRHATARCKRVPYKAPPAL